MLLLIYHVFKNQISPHSFLGTAVRTQRDHPSYGGVVEPQISKKKLERKYGQYGEHKGGKNHEKSHFWGSSWLTSMYSSFFWQGMSM
jgi:hypothetical protein